MPVSQWCYQCGRQLKVIGQSKICVKFVIGLMVGFDPSKCQSDRSVYRVALVAFVLRCG